VTADRVSDTILLTIPTAHGFRSVATLVLGGVGSRLELPYERVDDLQLAVLSVLDSATEDTVTLEVEAAEDAVAVAIGPLQDGIGNDRPLGNVLGRLVAGVEETQRDGSAWLRLTLPRAAVS
jgi:hypothetical protein